MIDLILAGVGILVALLGMGYSLLRPRDPDVAVLESGRRGSRSDA